jgi:hypothetical protein
MLRYLTSYRCFILTKLGLGIAYFWLCCDFLRLNVALQIHLQELIPELSKETFCGNSALNAILVRSLLFLSQPGACWIYFILSPVVVAVYIWGRFRWLQAGIAGWVWLSIAATAARVSVVMTTADFWLSWCFILYLISGVITPSGQWDVSQPSLRADLWRKNATISSEYACLLVVLQFTVYFYAGLNKLIFGWTAWTSGTALQDLMLDPAMHHYVRGLALPHLISLFLCYLTLAQRLIVPFWFFSWRYRRWAVMMLGLMHLGYEAVMQVTVFPLIGIACLLIVLPPRGLALPFFAKLPRKEARTRKSCVSIVPRSSPSRLQRILAVTTVILLLAEPAILSYDSDAPPYWNVKLATQLHWIMFADGGSQSKYRFKVRVEVQDPVTGQVHLDDVTDLPISYFHVSWRTRLYEQAILRNALAAQHPGTGYVSTDEYLDNYVNTAVKLYKNEFSHEPNVLRVVLAIELYDKKEGVVGSQVLHSS